MQGRVKLMSLHHRWLSATDGRRARLYAVLLAGATQRAQTALMPLLLLQDLPRLVVKSHFCYSRTNTQADRTTKSAQPVHTDSPMHVLPFLSPNPAERMESWFWCTPISRSLKYGSSICLMGYPSTFQENTCPYFSAQNPFPCTIHRMFSIPFPLTYYKSYRVYFKSIYFTYYSLDSS